MTFSKLQSKSALLIMVARIMSCLILAVIIANPSRIRKVPGTRDFKLVTLIDASKSMLTKDDSSQTRLSKIANILNNKDIHDNLHNFAKTETYLFADGCVPATLPFAVQPLPGDTNFGAALTHVLQMNELGVPVGAVLLLSDGRSNVGASPQDVAKRFANANIPVTSVVVAEDARPLDVAVVAPSQTIQAKRDEPFTLTAHVSANNPRPLDVRVQLLLNAVVLQETELQLPANADKTPVQFTVASPTAGLQTYVVRLKTTAPDAVQDNDTDFLSVQVEQPPVFKILYMANTLDWDWRFLSKLHEDIPSVQTSALILMGDLPAGEPPQPKPRFFTENVASDIAEFPENTDFYAPFDAVVADTRVFASFSEKAVQALLSFVENKGGGLLLKGPVENLRDDVASLLPAKAFAAEYVNGPLRLNPNPQFIFSKKPSSRLLSEGLFAPRLHTLTLMAELKKSARSALDAQLPGGQVSALAAHTVGAGRVLYLSSTATWTWKLSSDSSQVIYNDFWAQLAAFLAETGKPRFNCLNNGSKIPVDQTTDILLDVLGDDFLPAPDARVTLSTTAPDGAVATMELSPSLHELGRYETPFTPAVAGEYLLQFETRLQDAVHASQAVVIARGAGPESANTAPNPALMQDIARITAGRSLSLKELAAALRSPSALSDAIPLSPRVPMEETRIPLLPPPVLYLLLFASCMLAWWLRRSLSMK
jgi:hypothetical protein